uniref:Uncharacterized protein n=1 Tax=Mycena chlorophos TaxID=658473 RepID=A0ABQ0MA29_MYCCL|nr:predicted protein [Mycena chlorophos]
MFLTAETKHSLNEAISLVQRTLRTAESEIERAAEAELARMREEVDQLRKERDDALKAARDADVLVAQRETFIETLQREVTHWQEQSRNWAAHYTRVEQERCGLATELVALSRSKFNESPPKRESNTVPPPTTGPPSPSDSGSPQNIRSNPRTPASIAKGKGKQQQAEASTSKASTSKASTRPPTKAPTQPPRQIFLRRVQAVVHVKEEEDDGEIDMGAQEEDEEEDEEEDDELDSVRVVKRRRSGLMVADEEDYRSSHEEEDEESGDELMMDSTTLRNSNIYGGILLQPNVGASYPTVRRAVQKHQSSANNLPLTVTSNLSYLLCTCTVYRRFFRLFSDALYR